MSDSVSVRYRIPTRVLSVEFVTEIVRARMGQDGKPIVEKRDRGWFILFEGSNERLYLGDEKPELYKGQEVDILIVPKGTNVRVF